MLSIHIHKSSLFSGGPSHLTQDESYRGSRASSDEIRKVTNSACSICVAISCAEPVGLHDIDAQTTKCQDRYYPLPYK